MDGRVDMDAREMAHGYTAADGSVASGGAVDIRETNGAVPASTSSSASATASGSAGVDGYVAGDAELDIAEAEFAAAQAKLEAARAKVRLEAARAKAARSRAGGKATPAAAGAETKTEAETKAEEDSEAQGFAGQQPEAATAKADEAADKAGEQVDSKAAEPTAEKAIAEVGAERTEAPDEAAEKAEDKAAEEKAGEGALAEGLVEGGDAKPTREAATAPAKGRGFPLKTVKARVSATAAATVVLGGAIGGFVWYHDTHVPSDVAFRIYGNNVTISALNDDMRTDQVLYGFVPPTGPKLDQFKRDFAKANAVSMVIDHAAAERNIVVADRQVSETLASYISQVYGPGDDGHTKFVRELANQGTSEPKVLAELKRQITLSQLTQQVTAGVQVSDQELQQYFDTHKAQLATPETRDLHNLVVATQSQAQAIVDQIKAGANFERLAQQQSLDTSTKGSGGELGQVSAQQLEPDYAQAASAVPTSGIFGPVQTSHGWNVGKVVSINPGGPAVFAQIKDQLRQYLIEQKQADKLRAFLSQQIKDADVAYNPTYRPAQPDELPPASDQLSGTNAPAAPPPRAVGGSAAPAPPK